MITTMDMGSYEIEQDEMEIQYGEEILSVGWNPAVDLVYEQLQEAISDEQISALKNAAMLYMPDNATEAASEMCMRRKHSYQH